MKLLLKLSTFAVLFGRGYQYLFWDVPLRAFLWDEELISPILKWFNINWMDYSSSPLIDKSINTLGICIGIFFISVSLGIWIIKNEMIKISLLKVSFILLSIIFLLYWKEQFFRIGNLMEHSLQWFTPLLLMMYYKDIPLLRIEFFIKILIALTFAGHGLYAIGFYPVPGNFIDMVIFILKVDEQTALSLLRMAGLFDFLAAICVVFFRINTIYLIVYYVIFWGFWTASARLISGLTLSTTFETVHQEWFKTLYRFPHALIPIALFIIAKKKKKGFNLTELYIV